jgi:hypothetical protein
MVDGRTEASVGMAAEQSAVAWSAVIAGGMAAATLTLVLVAFGAGMGFSSISAWPSSGVSAGTFKIAAGIYLLVIAMLSSTIGGYIAGSPAMLKIGEEIAIFLTDKKRFGVTLLLATGSESHVRALQARTGKA